MLGQQIVRPDTGVYPNDRLKRSGNSEREKSYKMGEGLEAADGKYNLSMHWSGTRHPEASDLAGILNNLVQNVISTVLSHSTPTREDASHTR